MQVIQHLVPGKVKRLVFHTHDIPVATPRIETGRLVLRGHRIEDLGDCAEMWGDRDVTRYIGGKPFSREEVWSIYADSKRRWIAGDLEYTHEGGESFADIRRRVVPVFESWLFPHRGQTFIVVAHGIVLRVLLTTLIDDLPPAEFDRIAIDFASINELVWDGHRWRAESLNRIVAPSPARPVA